MRPLPHPTPQLISLHIARAMRAHDEAHPEDRIPLSARRVVQAAIHAACQEHDEETSRDA